VRIGSPGALLATIPFLLGFQPENSFVIIGTEPPRNEVRLTLRYDLPDPPHSGAAAGIAGHAAGVLAAQHIETSFAVGYGPGELVTPVADAFRGRAPELGIAVREVMRAEDGRFWSYLCTGTGCCPAEGIPFDITAHPQVKKLAPGLVVLASRDELAATVAPVSGDAAKSMHVATRRAEEHAARLIARAARAGHTRPRRLLADAGTQAVAEAIARYRGGDQVASDKDAAWLTVVLRDLRVRDDAWARMEPEHVQAHLRLWSDLTRLARPGYVPAPASLLAFVAWQSGNGALANVALDRAQADDPDYSMAGLLRQVIDSGAPPSMARLPMTPDQVAASYDAQEADDDGENQDVEDADPDTEDGDEDRDEGDDERVVEDDGCAARQEDIAQPVA
jgi:hypothetical protein